MSVIELFIEPVVFLVKGLFGLVPSFSFPASFDSAVGTASGMIAGVSFFIPLGTALDIAVVFLVYYVIKLMFLNLDYFARKVPFMNMR